MSFDPGWFSGLTPSTILVVGAGYQREQIKDAVISRVGAVAGKWIFAPDQLAAEILSSEGRAPDPVTPAGRQEFFRLLFSNRSFLAQVPELKKLKRQEGFYRRLDQAVQTCREIVGHEEEREFLEGKLRQFSLGDQKLRNELVALSQALESWMESENIADSPRLFRLAIESLESASISGMTPLFLEGRQKVWRYQIQESQALESLFFSRLSSFIEVQDASALFLLSSDSSESSSTPYRWRRSHTLHDSVELLMSELRDRDWSRQVVLIPDTATDVRMVLRRALRDSGIPELDPRDPQEIRLNESFKRLFLPLECVSSGWDPAKVLSLLSVNLSDETERTRLRVLQRPLLAMGPRPGLEAILKVTEGELPVRLASSFRSIDQGFQGRLDFISLRTKFSSLCKPMVTDLRLCSWIEKFWDDFELDLGRVQFLQSRLPISLWLERIRGRLDLASSPLSALKPTRGIRIVRLSQANGASVGHDLWILGAPANWLSPSSETDFYLGSRERDYLSSELPVKSSRSVAGARRSAFQSWQCSSASVHFLDHAFELDGSEKESLESLITDLGAPEGIAAEELGAHERFLDSYGLVRTASGISTSLPAFNPSESVRVSATALDAMSKCSFLGLLQSRWKLSELEEADWELWPRVRGVLLHRAVERVVREWDLFSDGLDAGSILQEIWAKTWSEAQRSGEVPGWIQSPQLERQITRQAHEVLSSFLDNEVEYRRRSGVRCLATEDDARLSLSWTDARNRKIEIVGKADRIDEHPDGLFVLDYKTGTQSFKGGDILEKGYRLQLPFYALGAQERFHKPVLGVQLIELTRTARRSVGLFPKRLNGKNEGSLTQLGKNNSGLFDHEPHEVWSTLESKIHAVIDQFADGKFEAKPTIGKKECQSCRANLICGQARREWVLDSSGDASEEAGEE